MKKLRIYRQRFLLLHLVCIACGVFFTAVNLDIPYESLFERQIDAFYFTANVENLISLILMFLPHIMIIALLALFVLAAAIFGYRQLISQPRERKAAEMIAQAQYRFESTTPEYQLALEGDANGPGFLDVIDQYGSTRAGNLAKHYAGICYLRLGDLDNAAAYLAKYKPAKGIPAEIVNAQNIGLQGDIAVEKGDYAAAIKLFEKAAKVSDNNLTAPMYLRKAALAANAMGNKEQALGFAQRIQNEFPASAEAQNAEKLMGTIQQ